MIQQHSYLRFKNFIHMKTTQQCPKCQSKEIYTDAGLTKRGDRCSIPVTSWTKLFVDTYVCLNCGFIEEYVTGSELQNEKNLSKVRETFKRIS